MRKLFVVLGLFLILFLAGCQNVFNKQNYATQVGSGNWQDIAGGGYYSNSNNLANIYIDGYENLDTFDKGFNLYYDSKPIYISNISGLDIKGSDGLNLVISGDKATITPTKAGVLTIKSDKVRYLDFGIENVQSGVDFKINLYPSKIFQNISFQHKGKNTSFNDIYIYESIDNIYNIYTAIPPAIDFDLLLDSRNGQNIIDTGDIKFVGLVNETTGNSGSKLLDFIKKQNISIDSSGQNALKNMYISTNPNKFSYKIDGTKLITTLSKLQTGDNLMIIDRHNNIYMVRFNFDKLSISLVQSKEEDYDYNIAINANYPLDNNNIAAQLDKIFGSGQYDANLTSNYITIDYRPIPGKIYSGDLIVTDVFSQTGFVKINILHKNLKAHFVNTEIAGNTYNILPIKGSYNQFFVNYRNTNNLKYKISTCKTNYKGLINFSGENFSRGNNMENYLLDCSGGIIFTGSFTNTGKFSYRKTYTAKLDIPSFMSGLDHYKLEILSDGKPPNQYGNNIPKLAYFSRTNIGITTKISSGYIYIWPTYLDSGKFVTSGRLEVIDLVSGSKTQQFSLGKTPLIIINTGNVPKILSVFDNKDNQSIVVVGANGSSYYNSLSIESYLDTRNLLDNKYKNGMFGTDNKIYGYTDRGLYKPSDKIFFNGFVRSNNNKTIPKGEVIVTIQNPQDASIIYTSSGLKLDSFGGFKGSYNIPNSIKLGDYFVQYQFGDITNSANIKILEYQKPTFSADINYKIDKDNYIISILPKYYFGQNLTDYNIKTTINIQSQTNDYRRNTDKYYYNVDPDTYLGDSTKKFSNVNQSNEYLINYNPNGGISLPVESNIYVNTQVFDNKSNEVQTFEKYIDIKPQIMIGLDGQYQDRSDKGNFIINGELSGKSENISDIDKKYNLTYDIYYKDWNQENYNGVDGSIYYSVNGQYQTIKTGVKLNTNSDKFTFDVKMTKAGEYLIKIYIKDKDGTIVSVNSKYINYYDWSNNDAMMGLLPNNYQMQLKVDDKTYEFGDKVKLNLMPYIKGSKAIVTVEKNNEILDNFTYDLDGQEIYIPIKKGYEPNVNIYVSQIAGSDIDLGVRREPRFLAGMTNIDVDTSSNVLNIDIKTDKENYKPGDMVKMKIKTTDSNGKAIDSRLSVAVVDKSLNDMYSYIKEPLEYFYRKSVSTVGNFTNLKLLYLSLKSFIGGGSKGGGGSGPTSFGAIRNDLSDLAFWRSDIITTGGVAEFTFILPDNLTTRDTQVIGITKDTKLGVANMEFLTTKDLIVEPNLPLFVTLGDKLIIPTKIILNPKNKTKSGEMVKLTAKLMLYSGSEIIIGNMVLPVNKTALLPITIPYDLYDTNIAKIYVSAQYLGFTDAVVNTIPIRKNGFFLTNIYNQPLSKKGSINISNNAPKGKIETSVSGLPIFDANNILRYLLHYPYGCTEQLASGLFPILYARLSNPKLIDKSMMDGDNIYINNSGANIYDLTTNTITKILKNQNPDGGFGYRGTDASEYNLSAYVYNLMLIIKNNNFAKNINLSNNIDLVEKYLQNTKSDPSGYIFYIYYKTVNGEKVSPDTLASLQNMAKGTGGTLSTKILINYISAKSNGKIIYNITTDSLDKYDMDKSYTYNNFLDKYILASIQLRALIITKASSQDIYMIYNYLMKGKGTSYNNLRGRSTQTNVNILLAINDYTNYILTNTKDIKCQLIVGDKKYDVVLDKNNLEKKYILNYNNSISTGVSRNCDNNVLINAVDSFVNTNPKSIKTNNLGVKSFYFDFDDNKKIGSIINFTGGFSLTENGNQLAVEYFIPSNTKLLYNIQSKNNENKEQNYYGENLPFDFGGDYNCKPSHREVRFDRLFLYYNYIAKGISCKISINGIKAYDGVSNLQPSKIWEMYENNINGIFVK